MYPKPAPQRPFGEALPEGLATGELDDLEDVLEVVVDEAALEETELLQSPKFDWHPLLQ